MSIHILTSDPKVVAQLTELLAGGQQAFKFYDELEALIEQLPKFRKVDKVFYDLQLERDLMAFDALNFACKKTSLIAFEPLDDLVEEHRSSRPGSAEHYILLSSDNRKAGPRLKELIHKIDARATKKKATRKRKASKAKLTPRRGVKNGGEQLPPTISRYLTAKSESMQALLQTISEVAPKDRFIFITGEDGADFELAAREINFRANGDSAQLHIVDPMRVDIEAINKNVCADQAVSYCYLGQTYELGALSIERLIRYLEREAEPDSGGKPCFILSHVDSSESYLGDASKTLIQLFKDRSDRIAIPPMAERQEDIALIAQSLFTTLRAAHPFLVTRMLTREAIAYLESTCAEISYSSLIRNIRNAMALTERELLTDEELKNFGDDTPTAQHLIESLADEQFFKNQSGAA